MERNIVALRSRLRIGKTYTDDNVFDSIQFTGAQLTSDENMLPDSQRDFAPVVRGVANSNATIEIRQSGYLIYSKNVAPGAFDIDDINPSNQSGDLDVSVIEADGSRRNFSVPYSAVPNMLRADNSRFQFTAGEYRDGYSGGWRPRFVQWNVELWPQLWNHAVRRFTGGGKLQRDCHRGRSGSASVWRDLL